jgi:AraC-like DNA-binding protein
VNVVELTKPVSRAPSRRKPKVFSEIEVWRAFGTGWKQLHGSFRDAGVSFEWHDFTTDEPLDWAKSFHPGSIEICFNLAGTGNVMCGSARAEYTPLTAGFYSCGSGAMEALRNADEQHHFLTIEFSPGFLREHLSDKIDFLHPLVKGIVSGEKAVSGVSPATRLSNRQRELIFSLCEPPVIKAAQSIWYHSRALDLMAEFFFQSPKKELFCVRQKQVARERVDRVIKILQDKLSEPPTLEEIGREVGCSPFYLSRTFSKEMGATIPQYLRQIRMEKAAALLKSGKFNVTEVALEVGYNSPSHFSAAFHQTFGCCPGLYPLAPNHSGLGKIQK